MNFKKLLLILILVAGAVYLLFSYFFKDVQINKYDSIEAVRDQSAIQKGWVPAILPESASKIVETHDNDTNIILGSFIYEEKDEVNFIQNLTEMHDEKHTLFWENFLFRVDTSTNKVQFRNRVLTQ